MKNSYLKLNDKSTLIKVSKTQKKQLFVNFKSELESGEIQMISDKGYIHKLVNNKYNIDRFIRSSSDISYAFVNDENSVDGSSIYNFISIDTNSKDSLEKVVNFIKSDLCTY